jgi:transcriptional regulator with XRE-family HTH domain
MGDKLTPEARSLRSLRKAYERTQKDLAGFLGLKDGSLLSQFENGHKLLSGEYLEEVAATLGVPPEGVEALLFAHRLIDLARQAEAGEAETSRLALTAGERRRISHTAIAGGWTVAEVLFAELARARRAAKVERAKREAEEQWSRLKALPGEERRELVTSYPALRNPALVARVCEASARAAADSVQVARELADFARFIARRLPGGEGRRARAEGFAGGFVSNALRVATEFDAGDAAFGEAWELWQAGDPAEPELLPGWRLHDLEGSLRRAQRRFPEALKCIDRALALCGGEPAAAGHILLKKEHLFATMGDTERALAALEEAAPYVEATGDPHLLFALRFNTVDNLCTLKHYAEAAARLPAVRELAIEQGNELHLSRLLWLGSKIAAGQGRREEAIAGLEQVRQKFGDLPYEAALVSLDLAVLYLKAGRTVEVRQLAIEMGRIFRAKGIAREALAALSTFCEAARHDTVTVELIGQVIAKVERARRSAPPS